MKERRPMGYWAGTADELAQCYPASDANDGGVGYIRISRNNKVIPLHRWLWEEKYGEIPEGWEIDHINGITTDNRWKNLRCIPQKEQSRNKSKRADNVSGVQGVSIWNTTRRGNQVIHMWRAVATDLNGKQKIKAFSIKKYGNQGAFDLACAARKQMEKEYDYHPNHGR